MTTISDMTTSDLTAVDCSFSAQEEDNLSPMHLSPLKAAIGVQLQQKQQEQTPRANLFQRGRPNVGQLFTDIVNEAVYISTRDHCPVVGLDGCYDVGCIACGPEPLLANTSELCFLHKFDFQDENFRLWMVASFFVVLVNPMIESSRFYCFLWHILSLILDMRATCLRDETSEIQLIWFQLD